MLNLSTLNDAQRKAVETISGPVMVIAGPGTGKTHILTLRIAHILEQTDTPPDGILALTFTESGAGTMKQRLGSIIGAQAYRVNIHTFHGYAQSVINRFPEYFPRIIGSMIATDIQKISIMRHILDMRDWEYVRPFGNVHYYVSPLLSAISELKRDAIDPEKLRSHGHKKTGEHDETEAKRIERTLELADVYALYEQEMRKRKLYDFDDLLLTVVNTLGEQESLLRLLQEEALYVLADEHQDANGAQNKLLELLASFHDNPDIFVVGDEKQSIFRFQGASLENFHYFQTLFPKATLIALTDSYRSHQALLAVTHEVGVRASPHAVKLVGRSKGSIPPRCVVFQNQDSEYAFLANDIKRLIESGVPAHEIAVLYRKNADGVRFGDALHRAGIPVEVHGAQTALDDIDVLRMRALITACARPAEDASVVRALHVPYLPIASSDIFKIIAYARSHDAKVWDVLQSSALRSEVCTDAVSAEVVAGLFRRGAKFSGSVLEMLEWMLHESGLAAGMLKRRDGVQAFERMGALFRFVQEQLAANPFYDLDTLMHDFELVDEHAIKIATSSAGHEGFVQLMTAHRSKGMEFEHVYVVGVVDKQWGGNLERHLFDMPTGGAKGSDDDERRLLYVALTRAKNALTVTYPLEREGRTLVESRILAEIPEAVLQREKGAVSELPLLANTSVAPSVGEKEFIVERFKEQGLSVTALNNYLVCPWKYFYSSLIRIPMAPTKELAFGTAAHAGLRVLFDSEKRTLKTLLSAFDDAADRAPLPSKERVEMKERGDEFLSGWFEAWKSSWREKTKSEYKIDTVLDLAGEPVRLRGDLDKMEFLTERQVHVVDYKTGKPKTRNALMGKTKDEHAPQYYRQLTFYKLLLELEGKYQFEGGEIDFLQPDDKGKYHKEAFTITDDEVAELKKQIERVVHEITTLAFWEQGCNEKECEGCALRKLSVSDN